MNDFSSPDSFNRSIEIFNNSFKINEPVAAQPGDDEAQFESTEIVIVLNPPVHRQKDIEMKFGESEKRSILATAPTDLWNGLDMLRGEKLPHARRNALV